MNTPNERKPADALAQGDRVAFTFDGRPGTGRIAQVAPNGSYIVVDDRMKNRGKPFRMRLDRISLARVQGGA